MKLQRLLETSFPTRVVVALGASLLLVSLAVAAPTANRDQDAATVTIESGALVGELRPDGMRVYRGIPYAAPPIGSQRWQPPGAVAPWEGERSALEFGKICPQLPTLVAMTGEAFPTTDEDCLFLNVWTAAAPGDNLPVMVWIHGGGLTLGWSNQVGYEGSEFAKRGVVLVSINYRLGALGFLAHPELSAESAEGVSGNYGFLDQVAALEWVKRNITTFGGDPSNVTIFGESAGGTSVHALMASPRARGLFHRAIAQSPWVNETNITHLTEDSPSVKSSHALGVSWAKAMTGSDSPSLTELRALEPDAINKKAQAFSAVATIDGKFLPAPTEDIFLSGRQASVPMIVGTNTDEGTLFMQMIPAGTREAFVGLLGTVYGERAKEVAALYPSSDAKELRAQVNAYLTDGWFLRASRNMLLGHTKVEAPAYQYNFTRQSPAMPMLGAHHAAELGYVFNTLQSDAYGDTDDALAAAMIEYWVQFARTGDPNVQGLPAWPVFEPGEQKYLELGDEIKVGAALGKKRSDQLEKIRTSL